MALEDRNPEIEKVTNDNIIKRKYNKSDSKVMSILEHLLGLIDDFGFIFYYQLLNFFTKISRFIQYISSTISKDHYENMDIRNEVSPQINKLLLSLVTVTEADRAFIMEMHNGKENPSQLSFVYCDMTYEELHPSKELEYVYNEYENVNMSKYSFTSYLHEHRMFVGTIQDLATIDKKLAARMTVNDIKYCGFIMMTSGVDIGFLGVTYLTETPPISREMIQMKLLDYVQRISPKLDLTKQKELRELNLKK